jgi:hypothetical protein
VKMAEAGVNVMIAQWRLIGVAKNGVAAAANGEITHGISRRRYQQ